MTESSELEIKNRMYSVLILIRIFPASLNTAFLKNLH